MKLTNNRSKKKADNDNTLESLNQLVKIFEPFTRVEITNELTDDNVNPKKIAESICLAFENNNLLFGICIHKDKKNPIPVDRPAGIVYVEKSMSYIFHVKLLFVSVSMNTDHRNIMKAVCHLEDKDMDNYIVYLLEAIPVSMPKSFQRRAFFRVKVEIPIYYKIGEGANANTDKSQIYSEVFESGENLKKIENQRLDHEQGYIKEVTVDVSGGGFKFRSKSEIESGKILDCLIIFNKEILAATAEVIEAKAIESGNETVYETRVKFDKISELVRERIIKQLLSMQSSSTRETRTALLQRKRK